MTLRRSVPEDAKAYKARLAGRILFWETTVLQKITTSKDPVIFTMYREGIFYKCYYEDAMVFYERVRAFKNHLQIR